jgi:NADPH2:quinone reductase
MRAVRVHEYNSSVPMRVNEVEDPEPGPGEILLKAAAAGVNLVDLIIRLGNRGGHDEAELPYIPGHNTSGKVVAVGEGVSGFEPGQRVFGLAFESYASMVQIRADYASILPDAYTCEEGAGITSPFFTVWNVLVFKAAQGLARPNSFTVALEQWGWRQFSSPSGSDAACSQW